MWSYSQTEPTLWVPCSPSFCQLIIAFRCFRQGVTKSVVLKPWPSHRFCGFELKHRPGLFWANMLAWWLPCGDCGSHWSGPCFRLTCCAEATDSPKYSLRLSLGASLGWKLTRGVHNLTSFIVDTFYFLGLRLAGGCCHSEKIENETAFCSRYWLVMSNRLSGGPDAHNVTRKKTSLPPLMIIADL
jgi:hypothetical protein